MYTIGVTKLDDIHYFDSNFALVYSALGGGRMCDGVGRIYIWDVWTPVQGSQH